MRNLLLIVQTLVWISTSAEAADDHARYNRGKILDGFFQYSNVPAEQEYEFGFHRGNPLHYTSRYEQAQGASFRTKVKWGDTYEGYGESYWDYKHSDKTHEAAYQTETSGQNASPSEQSRILENQANVSDSTQSKRSLNSNHETAAFTAFHKPNAYQSDYSEAAPQPNSAGQYIPNSKPHAYKKPNDHRPWHSYQNEAETEHQVIRPVPYKEPTTLHKPEGFSSQYHPERPVYKPAKAEHPKFNGVHKTVPYLSQYGSAPIHPLNKPDPYQEHQYHPYSNQHQSPLDYHPFETNSYKEPDFHKPSSPSTYSTHHKPEPEYLGEFKPTTFESSYNTKPKYSFPYKPDSYETSHNPHSDDVGVPLYRPKAQKPYQHSIVSGNIKPYHHSTYPYSQSHHEPKPEYHAAHKPTSYEPPYKPHDYYGDVPVYWPKLQKGENYASPYHRPDHLLNFR